MSGPLPTTYPPEPLALARTHVEAYLRRPVALISGERLTVQVPEDGVVALPWTPIVSVDTVALVSGDPLPPYSVLGSRIYGLPPYAWVVVTYTHGWPDDAVPDPVITVMQAVASRIAQTPPGVRLARNGDLRVDYGSDSGAPALTDDEKDALFPLRVERHATTLRLAPDPSPRIGWSGGLAQTGGMP